MKNLRNHCCNFAETLKKVSEITGDRSTRKIASSMILGHYQAAGMAALPEPKKAKGGAPAGGSSSDAAPIDRDPDRRR